MSVDTQERLSILQDISKSWLELAKTIGELSDEQIVKPAAVDEWSVKDIMAHVTFWENQLIGDVESLEKGEKPAEVSDYEALNREQAARDRSTSVNVVRSQFDATHARLMEKLETTNMLSRDLVGGETYNHYNEHRTAIKAAFP